MQKNCCRCPVEFTQDAFAAENPAVANALRAATGSESPRVMLVADMNMAQRVQGIGSKIGRYFQHHGIALAGEPVVLAGGEKAKCEGFASVLEIASAAIAAKTGRGDAMLAIGGGSVLDVAGYAAAQVRGCMKTVRMPTTVAAMIDGAYADSACMDLDDVKDAMRVPSEPSAVVVDTTLASTVLDGVWRGGYSEAVRAAVVSGPGLMARVSEAAEQFRARSVSDMSGIIEECARARLAAGETGFAQWCALRLEAMSGYKLPHGYAVAIGIFVDCTYAMLRGLLPESDRAAICGALADSGAMDGAVHSRHLFARADEVLLGLDAWRLSTGSEAIVVPKAPGEMAVEERPDRGAMKKALDLIQYPS